ncbi:alpha/beta hydrolase [Bryobacter aggregatus]|uniref:alpha/beta hydrolase n=1 Tax=Bryobacter aggregatus TaxID=360054 RepID=UPI00068C6D6F|nr:alpha/beta hydrolase [Bryobacter aggregatus]
MKSLWLLPLAACLAQAAHYNIPLWDQGKVPLSVGDGPLDQPFLTVFSPPAGKANGSSVVIAPGGSNIMLMYGAEGMEIAERYNEWGVTAFVLTYRLSPRYDAKARTLDGKRAMQIVRSKAAEMKLDPKRVGFIGFSAGSETARYTVATATAGDPNSPDPVERFGSKPDYVGLIYSTGRPTPGEELKNFPPVFLCAAQFDRGPALGSAQFFTDLTKAGAIAELHLYQKGRHGFGAAFGSSEFGQWMDVLQHFLSEGGFLGK